MKIINPKPLSEVKKYREENDVPAVKAEQEEMAIINDDQDAMIIDLATQVAILNLTM